MASVTRGQARDFALMRQWLDDWRGSHKRGVAFPLALWSAAGRVAQRVVFENPIYQLTVKSRRINARQGRQ